MPIGSIFSGIFGLASGVSRDAANLRAVRETNEQNRQLTYEAWGREDNAVQRRVADLQAAGINPMLAAGQGAASSGAQKMEAPHHQGVDPMVIENALRMRDEFKTSRMNRKLMEKQAGLIEATTEEHRANAERIRQQYRHEEGLFPYRLEDLQTSIRLHGSDVTLRNLQIEGQRLHNEYAPDTNRSVVLDNIRREVENTVAESTASTRISREEVEMISQTIANELASHRLDVYQELGHTGTGPERIQALEILRNMTREARESINNWWSGNRFNPRNWGSGR